MSLYKVAKTLQQIQEERSHRNRRLKAAPYLAGGVAAAASLAHDTVRKTGATQLVMRKGKMKSVPQRQYHVLRYGGVGKHVENSIMKSIPRAAAAGFATAGVGAAYKFIAEERAKREAKLRRQELRKSASLEQLQKITKRA